MEAVKQGSATVGVKSKTHAVLAALKVYFVLINNFNHIQAPDMSVVKNYQYHFKS